MADEPDRAGRLYLDDFHVGQRFTSATHVVDAAQIKVLLTALASDPL